MQNRCLARCCVDNWFLPHKFLDPTKFLDSPLSTDTRQRDPELYDANLASLELELRAVFHRVGESTEMAWIFMPYNIGYDFQSFNYISIFSSVDSF